MLENVIETAKVINLIPQNYDINDNSLAMDSKCFGNLLSKSNI